MTVVNYNNLTWKISYFILFDMQQNILYSGRELKIQ